MIYSHGPANGGHYHSLDTLSKYFAKELEIGIISIGSNPSPIIDVNPHFIEHFDFSAKTGYLKFLNRIKPAIANWKPDVVHCFDAESFLLLVPFLAFCKYRVVLNKCGGPNPLKERWVYCKSIVFFSRENFDWFSQNAFYRNSKIYLVPDRVEDISLHKNDTNDPKRDETKFSVVRITRISRDYWHTMKLAVNVTAFFARCRPSKLFVIGSVYEKSILKALLDYAREKGVEIEVISDVRAIRAVKMLYLADIAIGTGRSIMEAMALGLPVLAPASNSEFPILINDDNFNHFFERNFSQRVVINSEIQHSIQPNLLDICNNVHSYNKAKLFSREMFDKYFNVSNAIQRYSLVYQQAPDQNNLSLLFKNFDYVLKVIVQCGRR